MELTDDEVNFIGSSDSENDLEDTPAFIKEEPIDDDVEIKEEKTSRLDDLLAEHRQEADRLNRLQVMRSQLMQELSSNGVDTSEEDKEDLTSEHAEHIEKLTVRTVKLKNIRPGAQIFRADKYCCLFTSDLPWYEFTLENINCLVYPTSVCDGFGIRNDITGCLQWLLNLLSICPCDFKASMIQRVLMNTVNYHHSQKSGFTYSPSALGLLRLLVNLGADPSELTKWQTWHTQETIEKYLAPVKTEVSDPGSGKLNSDRFKAVLEVLTAMLSVSSDVPKEDLSLMFFMLAKTALDVSLDMELQHTFLNVFSAIVTCYNNSEWPDAVLELCLVLSQVSDHHHNQMYLVDLLPAMSRGSYLRKRLSYACLYQQLCDRRCDFPKLREITLSDMISLGVPVDKHQPSSLAVRLHHLLTNDSYKTFSVLKLLDMAVDVFEIPVGQLRHLEYALSQLNLVRRSIRDRDCQLDLTKVKDVIYHLTVKWSLALQHQRMKAGSIFPWATATTHCRVREEVLVDQKDTIVSHDVTANNTVPGSHVTTNTIISGIHDVTANTIVDGSHGVTANTIVDGSHGITVNTIAPERHVTTNTIGPEIHVTTNIIDPGSHITKNTTFPSSHVTVNSIVSGNCDVTTNNIVSGSHVTTNTIVPGSHVTTKTIFSDLHMTTNSLVLNHHVTTDTIVPDHHVTTDTIVPDHHVTTDTIVPDHHVTTNTIVPESHDVTAIKIVPGSHAAVTAWQTHQTEGQEEAMDETESSVPEPEDLWTVTQ